MIITANTKKQAIQVLKQRGLKNVFKTYPENEAKRWLILQYTENQFFCNTARKKND